MQVKQYFFMNSFIFLERFFNKVLGKNSLAFAGRLVPFLLRVQPIRLHWSFFSIFLPSARTNFIAYLIDRTNLNDLDLLCWPQVLNMTEKKESLDSFVGFKTTSFASLETLTTNIRKILRCLMCLMFQRLPAKNILSQKATKQVCTLPNSNKWKVLIT